MAKLSSHPEPSLELPLVSSLLDALPQLLWATCPDGRVLLVNQTFSSYTGLSLADTQDGGWRRCLHPDDIEAHREAWEQAVILGQTFSWEYRLQSAIDGHWRWFLVREVPEWDENGQIIRWVGTATDIDEVKQREADRERLLADTRVRAERDPLTGLLNRAAFHACLTDALLGDTFPCALVLFDINNFKFFNDAYGHLAGDEVLIAVARVLRSGCKVGDVLARLGGDEFALFLPGMDLAAAERRVGEMKDLVNCLGYRPSSRTHAETEDSVRARVPLGLSGGIAVLPQDAASVEKALAVADERLYLDKVCARASWSTALVKEFSERFPGFSALDSLVTAVDAKDRYTQRHSEDVLILAVTIGQALGLDQPALEELQVAALVHDVGKIGVPDRLLRLPGELGSAELALIEQHSLLGTALIESAAPALIERLPSLLPAVRHHHERWDGAGYPDRLTGEAIPLSARILSVADAFAAMKTERPYRHGMPVQEVLVRLWEGAGSQWDPACVDALLRIMGNEGVGVFPYSFDETKTSEAARITASWSK